MYQDFPPSFRAVPEIRIPTRWIEKGMYRRPIDEKRTVPKTDSAIWLTVTSRRSFSARRKAKAVTSAPAPRDFQVRNPGYLVEKV